LITLPDTVNEPDTNTFPLTSNLVFGVVVLIPTLPPGDINILDDVASLKEEVEFILKSKPICPEYIALPTYDTT